MSSITPGKTADTYLQKHHTSKYVYKANLKIRDSTIIQKKHNSTGHNTQTPNRMKFIKDYWYLVKKILNLAATKYYRQPTFFFKIVVLDL